jgi:hypothetical protein
MLKGETGTHAYGEITKWCNPMKNSMKVSPITKKTSIMIK